MAVNNPLVTLDEVYWWLNDREAPVLRPPLHEMLDRFMEAEKTADRQAVEAICQQFAENELGFLRSPVKETAVKLHNSVKIWIARDVEAGRKKLQASGGSYLRNPAYAYVLKLREAACQDPANAWVLLDQLFSLSNKITDDREAGEILVECGRALYKLQKRERAIQLFQAAMKRYNSYNHQIACVYWMIGFTYWELGQLGRANLAWCKSVTRFEKLASQRISQTASDMKWYREALRRMNATIEYAVEHTQPPAALLPEAASSQANRAAIYPRKEQDSQPAQAAASEATEPLVPIQEAQPIMTTGDLLEALPIIAEIPAGPWKQTRGDRNIIGQVTIDQVLINNQPHFLKNLRGGHIISLATIDKHVVIHISGDSMNAAQPTPIEDGDYVLLRRQNTAQAGDIVVAKIMDQTTRGPLTTIKRFLIDGQPLLKGESTDPKYGKLDEEFKIDGLAVAVFKPVFKANPSDTEPS
jgi:SOS-response transcriptional repressor LexA